ncbi:MAG: hypothetical protein FWD01_01180 [Defluviitaleaceae bacterium]|nr:hypothetical protein [Defluviitaleaceae bacterium]
MVVVAKKVFAFAAMAVMATVIIMTNNDKFMDCHVGLRPPRNDDGQCLKARHCERTTGGT